MMVVGATTALGLREGHSANYPVATSVPVGAEIRVAGNVLNANRYRCEWDGRVVYAADDYPKSELPQTVACSVSALSIRDEADINADIVGTLAMGGKVGIFAGENDWLRYKMEDGRVGCVYDECVEAVGQ